MVDNILFRNTRLVQILALKRHERTERHGQWRMLDVSWDATINLLLLFEDFHKSGDCGDLFWSIDVSICFRLA